MSVIKPYTFEAGTKARANEVNENFDVIYAEVNNNSNSISNNSNSISNLETTKANVNGNVNNVFKVRDPVASQDAVNKQTLVNRISNSVNIIDGLFITIDSTSNNSNNTILVSAGSCYDSSGSYILKLNGVTSKTNTIQEANVSYNVYLFSNNNGNSVDIIISPDEYATNGGNLYRKIGYYKSNNDNKITLPVSLSSKTLSIKPNYSAGITSNSVSSTVNWVAPSNGWIVENATNTTWRIDGYVPYNLLSFIPKGSKLTGTSTTAYTFNFLPCIGEQ